MITTSSIHKIVGHWTVPLYCLALWWGMLSVMLMYWASQGVRILIYNHNGYGS